MKRFFITISLISILTCIWLYLRLNYSFVDLAYHLLLIAILCLIVVGANFILTAIRHTGIRNLLTNLANYLFFLSLCIFYLLVIGSNLFWGKTITLSIIHNYVTNINSLISILPVQSWIFYSAILIILILISTIFLIIRPHPEKLYQRFSPIWERRRIWLSVFGSLALFLLLTFVFRNQLRYAKQRIHFSNEPLLQFTLGPMWNANAVPLAFDSERFKLGLKDQQCTDAIKPDTTTNTPTIVIILLDALRADHLSMYGYQRKTTPFLDSLSNSGHLKIVKNAFSNSNMTSGGVSGLFYSRDWENFGYNGLSLMKFMKRINYKTYAFLTGFHRDWYDLSALYRTNCDYYYESAINPYANNDDDLPTVAEIKKHSFPKNSLIYIHLLSTHTIGKKNEPYRVYKPDKIDLGTGAKEALVNNYDNGILQGDDIIRQIFNKLKQDGLLSNTILYVVSDHGELFGEDGRWSHGGDIHQQLFNIPILIYDTARNWYNNLESATIKDIAPSIVDRLGYKVPACWEGISLSRPPHDFSVNVNSGINCDLPQGILTKKDSSYTLQIMNKNKEVKKVFTTTGYGADWQPVSK